MEKGRSSKIIAIVALCVAVVGLSLGFAAFSSNLVIKSNAEVKPDASTFNVDFSTTEGSIVAGTVAGTVESTAVDALGAKILPTAGDATIDNSEVDSVIKDIKATFTTPGQTVTYTFWAHNGGQYDAYLNSVVFSNAIGKATADAETETDLGAFKYCTPGTGTDASMVAAACENISLSVKVGNDTFTSAAANLSAAHQLLKGTSEPVVVTITYTGTALADGDFTVYFGDITLGYDSVNEVVAG